MKDNMIQDTCQSLSLPLYALIHDSVVKALKASRISRQAALAIMDQIPKPTISANEQNELEKAQGLIQLEDSFGSGSFFIIGAGENQAFVCTEEKHADYLDQLMKSHSEQDFLPQEQLENQQNIQNQSRMQNQVQSQGQGQGQLQQNQANDQDMLSKLQLIDWILKGSEQKQKQGTIKVGQSKQQKDQNLIQKMALIELMQGKDTNEVLKNLQMFQMIEELSFSGDKQNLTQ